MEGFFSDHKAKVDGQFPPRFVRVLRKVMYVPPTAGSEILAKNAMIATNMQFAKTCKVKKFKLGIFTTFVMVSTEMHLVNSIYYQNRSIKGIVELTIFSLE